MGVVFGYTGAGLADALNTDSRTCALGIDMDGAMISSSRTGRLTGAMFFTNDLDRLLAGFFLASDATEANLWDLVFVFVGMGFIVILSFEIYLFFAGAADVAELDFDPEAKFCTSSSRSS